MGIMVTQRGILNPVCVCVCVCVCGMCVWCVSVCSVHMCAHCQ